MRNVKKLAIPVVIILVLLIAGISVASYLGSEIELAEYIEIEGVAGLDGQGKLQYGLDTAALSIEMFGEANDEEVTEENFEAIMAKNFEKYEEIDNAIDCISVTADKESGLSNGDTVTVTATFSNTGNHKFSYHFKDGSQTYTVSGLVEGKTVDPFSENAVSISFSGLSGQAVANLEILSHEEPISLFSYELTPAHNLSNGDTVTLKATANANMLEEKGYFLPEITEMTYTVSGLAEYYDFSNGFPVDELSALCENALAASKTLENEEVQDGYTITSPSKIHKVYSMKINDADALHWDYDHNVQLNNAVCIITSYYIEGTGFFPLSREEWSIWIYPNYFTNTDGNISHDAENNYDMFMLAETVEEVQAWLYEEYGDMTFTEMNPT